MDCSEEIVQYYVAYRTAMFMTSLTLGTFLFSMKSFIIKAMKDEVYDQAYYQMKIMSVRIQHRQYGRDIPGYYDQLRNLSKLLAFSISCAFLSALLHATLGWFEHWIPAAICLGATLTSWSAVGWSVWIVSGNWLDLIEEAETAAVKKHKGSEDSAQRTNVE